MKYELREVDTLVSTYLRPFSFLEEMNPERRKEFTETVRGEGKRICQALSDVLCDTDNGQQQLYIRRHQSDIVVLLDKVCMYRRRERMKDVCQYVLTSHVDYYNLMLDTLITVYVFLHRKAYSFFDTDMPLPHFIKASNHDVVVNMRHKVDSKLCRMGIDERLRRIALEPMIRFERNERVTLHDLWYLQNYRDGLKRYFERYEVAGMSLCNLLIELDMNEPALKEYYQEKISCMLLALQSPRRKLHYCYYHLKLLGQIKTGSEMRFDKKLPSLKKELKKWIKKEVDFLERTGATSMPCTVEKPAELSSGIAAAKTKPEAPPVQQKVKLNVAAATLAQWTRLLVAKKIIQTDNVEELLSTVAKAFITLRTDNISAGKFSNSYYSPEPWTINIVKDQVIAMLNMLNKKSV